MVALGLEMRIRRRCETQVGRTLMEDNECEISFVYNQLLQVSLWSLRIQQLTKGHVHDMDDASVF